MPKTKRATDAIVRELREYGLAYPGAHTKSPWPGHLDLAVKDKTFAYLSVEGEPFGISCKLPHSSVAALMFPFAKPTPYGLGKSGWVSASFDEGQPPPVALLKAWIDESYRAQAPKKLLAQLGEKTAGPRTAKPKPAAKKAKSNARRATAKRKAKAPAARSSRPAAKR